MLCASTHTTHSTISAEETEALGGPVINPELGGVEVMGKTVSTDLREVLSQGPPCLLSPLLLFFPSFHILTNASLEA